MTDYYQKKYYKYKNKYNELKILLGGDIIEFYDGTYDGMIKKRKKQGDGMMTYKNGDVYIGSWENDKKKIGTMTYINGDIYVGSWNYDMKSGNGTMTYKNGDIYTGSWLNDKKDGEGIFECKSEGYTYDGTWYEDLKKDYGKIKYDNGSSYEGKWMDDMKEGDGQYTDIDGTIYECKWHENKKHGVGYITKQDERGKYTCTMTWDNDITHDTCDPIFEEREYEEGKYKGFFNKDNRSGYGVMTYNNSSIYEGMWKNNNINGNGIMTYNDRSIYEGMWKNNMRTGYGVMNYNDGSIYEGMWKDNMRTGYGVMNYSDNTRYEGNWHNDMKHGRGIITSVDGSFNENTWETDRRSDEDYEIVLFILAHGCDMSDTSVRSNVGEKFYENITPTYVGFGNYGCPVWRHRKEKLQDIYQIFKTNMSTESQLEQIIHYINRKAATWRVPIVKDVKLSIHRPGLDHIYSLYNSDEITYSDATNENTGIFVIKNNMGIPNKINLFDWSNKRNPVNKEIKEIKELSEILVRNIHRGSRYNSSRRVSLNQIKLSSILVTFKTWFSKHKKLKLTIIDSSCRTPCNVLKDQPKLIRSESVDESSLTTPEIAAISAASELILSDSK